MTVPLLTPPASLAYAARGPAAGVVCGAGAVLAHGAAGGSVDPGSAVVVLLAAAGLGRLLVRGPVDALQTFGLALVAQVLWHGALMVGAAPAPHQSGAGMALTHLLAAVVTTVVALGVERELVLAACRRIALVLPAAVVLSPPRPAPAPAPVQATADVVPGAPPLAGSRALRAPPA